ncbi:hypothetical protein Acr_03g0012730 [Actinidia rufa]|uniref:HAT C-terminal dimerisation domain-containing protein n=1 Tax=Actinidia rufa TaxID=165716 RepID=A0A7J0EF61_9ERIC|nr:hypothetical protein Acr_03g0012730 [Actinidia rufa]
MSQCICLGFALSPRFYDSAYVSILAPGGTTRKRPNEDKEVVAGVLKAFEKIASDPEEARMLRKQFVDFHMRKGLYLTATAFVDATTMGAIEWWATYGSKTPELAEVARKVLAQPITTSSAEKNWSTYSYIHNVKRNRRYDHGGFPRLEEMRWNSLDDDNDETQQEQQPQANGKNKDQHTTHGSRVHGLSSTPLVPVPQMRSQQSQISRFIRRGVVGGPSSSKDKGKKIA